MKGKSTFFTRPLVLGVMVALTVALSACGGASPTPSSKPATQPPAVTSPAVKPPVTTATIPGGGASSLLPATNLPAQGTPGSTPPTIGTPGPTSTTIGTPGATSPRATAAAPGTPNPTSVTGVPMGTGLPFAVYPALSPTGTGPAVRIVYPENYADFRTSVTSRDIQVVINVANFRVVDKIGQPNVAGEGHIVYYLDAAPPTTAGASALSAAGTYFATTSTAMVWLNVPSGPHKIAAQLVNNDNTPLSPPVFHRIQTYLVFNIGAPDVKIIAPSLGATVPAGNVTINLQVRDFVLVDKTGQPNFPGQGHIIYYMDTEPPIVPGQIATTEQGTFVVSVNPTYTWTNVKPGIHTFYVQLVSNDNLTLGAQQPPPFPALDRVTVVVQ